MKTKKGLGAIVTGTLVAGAMISTNASASSLVSFDDLGSGAELRADLLDASVTGFKSGEAKCGEAKDAKSESSEAKSAEHKCGEGKCGEAKEEKSESKAMSTDKKAEKADKKMKTEEKSEKAASPN